MSRKYLAVVCIILALVLALAGTALAARAPAIGRFLHLEGKVDILKGGKLPAVPAKITEFVDAGDVIRTKSKSRAQVLFIDDSILTLAPESKVAVADFFYDRTQGQRRVLIQLFRGLAHTVVKHILELQGPDFLMHTQTVVIGVRGTEWYTLIRPNSTNVYNLSGLLELSSSNPRIIGSIFLQALEYREVRRDQVPGPARSITPAILTMLRRMMYTGVTEPLPDISGPAEPRPGVEGFKLPAEVMPPYAPTLTPAHPGRMGPVTP
jgi:hypothetical protein